MRTLSNESAKGLFLVAAIVVGVLYALTSTKEGYVCLGAVLAAAYPGILERIRTVFSALAFKGLAFRAVALVLLATLLLSGWIMVWEQFKAATHDSNPPLWLAQLALGFSAGTVLALPAWVCIDPKRGDKERLGSHASSSQGS